MANFCKYCGKPLQEGEICSCPQAQAEAAQQYQGQQPPQGGYQPPQGGYQPPQGGYQPPQGGFQPPQGGYQPPQGGYQPPQGYQPQQPAGPNPFVLALKKILPYLKSYLKSPVGAAQELIAQKDMIFAGILLGIQAIIGGLALFGILQGLCNFINGFTRIVSTTVGASIIWSMIFGILAGVVVLAIFIVLLFAVVKICGSGCTFLDVIVAAAAHSPFVSVLLLAGFLLFLLFMPLGAIVFLTAMLAWMLLAVPTAQALIPNGTQGKFWICIIVGTALALVIGVWAATSLGGNAVGHMTIKYSDGKTQTFNEMGRNILSLLDMF